MNWRDHIARFGTTRFPGERWVRNSFVALLLLAAVLRFWNLPELPYTHDELSALIRLYPTLGETVQKGVIELDTHPPGVQVFEWLWTRVFTLEEADVKLPFILMDLAALLLLYRFALAWTGNGAALLLTTLMATLQYSVLYGQIARPYAVGLFTTALLADQLTRWLAFGESRTLVGVGLAAVLSAYTHHFALMLATIMLGTGLLLLERKRLKAYLIMCGAVLLLYLPNVPIFLIQLGQGGLTEWLQPPGEDWMMKYAWFIANDSPFLAAALILTVVGSVVLTLRSQRSPSRWFLFLWGALPLLIGYAYSVWRAPVLQYSMLLFSFPHMALFFLHGLAHLQKKAVLITCGIFACISVHSLVTVRLHYDLFYHSKYEAMLRVGLAAAEASGKDRTLMLFDAPDNVLRFYLGLWKIPFEELGYVQLRDNFDQAQLDSLLMANSDREVIYGQSNGARPEHAALIQQRFPNLVERQDLFDGEVFHFMAQPVAVQRFDRDTVASLSPRKVIGPWRVADHILRHKDTTGIEFGWDYTDREFGIDIELLLDSITFDPSDQVEVIAEVDGWTAACDASIVAEVRARTAAGTDSSVFYRGGKLDAKHREQGTAAMVVTVSPADIQLRSPLRLLTYVFNPTKAPLHVRRITILRRQANPVRYSTLDPVQWPGRFPAK